VSLGRGEVGSLLSSQARDMVGLSRQVLPPTGAQSAQHSSLLGAASLCTLHWGQIVFRLYDSLETSQEAETMVLPAFLPGFSNP
jgi:hypothetical protein